MALGDGPRRIRTPGNGAGDIHLHLPPKRAPELVDSESDEPKSKIQILFETLGADDRVKVYRQAEGEELYSGTLPAQLVDDLEDQMAKKFGGGKYRLVGFSKGKNVGSAYITIDAGMFGPAKSREEIKAAAAPPAPAAPPVDPLALMQKFEELLERRLGTIAAQRPAPAAPDPNAAMIPLLATMLDNQNKITLAAMTRSHSAGEDKGGGSGDAFAQLKSVASLAETLGYKKPGESDRPLTEALLLKAADRAGEFIASKWTPGSVTPAATPNPTPAAPAPQLAARIPAEAKPLDAATVEKLRASIQRPGASAPSGRDVMPEAKK